MILFFEPQFNKSIIEGDKIHTIRKGNRWNAGMYVRFWNPASTADKLNFHKDSECISVQEIKIRWHEELGLRILKIWIDGRFITGEEQRELAENDGFETMEQFTKWFNDSFDGQIVHWTNYQYG